MRIRKNNTDPGGGEYGSGFGPEPDQQHGLQPGDIIITDLSSAASLHHPL